MVRQYSEIVVPDLGLFSHYPPEAIPRKMVDGRLHIGLHYCRNISLSRKEGVIKKSKGIANFTNSATGATDSVRGIGILNKFAIPQNFESGAADRIQVGASGDDAVVSGDAAFVNDGSVLRAGRLGSTTSFQGQVAQSSDDWTTFYGLAGIYLHWGGGDDTGIRFQNLGIAKDATITSAKLYLWPLATYGTPTGFIYGENNPSPAVFSDQADFDSRLASKTTAKVNFNALLSGEVWWYYDVTTIVDEVTSHASWGTSSDIAFLFEQTGGGWYRAASVDWHPSYAPILVITAGGQETYHFGFKVEGISTVTQGNTITSARFGLKLNSLPNPAGQVKLRIYGHDADTAWRDTGTHDGAGNAAVLADSTASWTESALIGLTVKNRGTTGTPKNATATITANSPTSVTGVLSGAEDWDVGDRYEIYEPGEVRDIWDAMQDHLTTAYVDWEPDTDELSVGDWIISPDITAIIQEIVDRAGWDEDSIAIFVKDNSSDDDEVLNVRSYDYAGNVSGPILEITNEVTLAGTPTFYMFVKGATEGEVWKLDANKDPSDVSQAAKAYANSYQSQLGRFLQFGDDLIFSDDGKSDPQIWDASASPSLLVDLTTALRGRYPVEFKRRVWWWYTVVSSVINKVQGIYSAVIDATTYDTTNDVLPLMGADAVRFAIAFTEDTLVVFKENSSYRIVDRQTSASDFQPYLISSQDGSGGGNVTTDGARLYGINPKGVFQWPIANFPGGFRYISKPIQDIVDDIPLTKMNLVYFAHDPVNKLIKMNCPTGQTNRNVICVDWNYEKDLWENVSDIHAGNVMENAFDTDGNPIILIGKEDGHLKYITGEQNEGADFAATLDTGALFLRDRDGQLISRKLIGIEPITNYEGSYTLYFTYKVYDRPGDEAGTAWAEPYYTHATRIGSEEYVPVVPGAMGKFHKIRIEGRLKDEPFEIQALRLIYELGGTG